MEEYVEPTRPYFGIKIQFPKKLNPAVTMANGKAKKTTFFANVQGANPIKLGKAKLVPSIKIVKIEFNCI